MKITELNKVPEQQTQAPVKAESKGCLNARTVAYAAVATGLAVAVAAAVYYTMQTMGKEPVCPSPCHPLNMSCIGNVSTHFIVNSPNVAPLDTTGFNATNTTGFNATNTTGFNATNTTDVNATNTTDVNATNTTGFNAVLNAFSSFFLKYVQPELPRVQVVNPDA